MLRPLSRPVRPPRFIAKLGFGAPRSPDRFPRTEGLSHRGDGHVEVSHRDHEFPELRKFCNLEERKSSESGTPTFASKARESHGGQHHRPMLAGPSPSTTEP